MPIIRSAIKKLSQDKKHALQNLKIKKSVRLAIKKYKKNPSLKLFSLLDSELSGAVKKNIVHANKSARLKSRLSKLLGQKKETGHAEKVQTKKVIKPAKAGKKSTKSKKIAE